MAWGKSPRALRKSEQTTQNFLGQVGRGIVPRGRSAMVYGEATERNGITVIPVTKVRYGFGAGGGHSEVGEEGAGLGGGLAAKPMGFIEITNKATRFRPIRDPAAFVPLLLAGGLFGWLLLRGAARFNQAR